MKEMYEYVRRMWEVKLTQIEGKEQPRDFWSGERRNGTVGQGGGAMELLVRGAEPRNYWSGRLSPVTIH